MQRKRYDTVRTVIEEAQRDPMNCYDPRGGIITIGQLQRALADLNQAACVYGVSKDARRRAIKTAMTYTV